MTENTNKRETVDEILANWENKNEFRDWAAVDQYKHGYVSRLYVGTPERAAEVAFNAMNGDGEPGCIGGPEDAPFYRWTYIQPEDAREYFEICAGIRKDWITQAEAADILDLSRARVHRLVEDGRLEADGAERAQKVTRESVIEYKCGDRRPGRR